MKRLLIPELFVFTLIAVALWSFGQACAPSKAGTLSAQEIAAPNPDVRCYAVLEDGKAVGGNCVPK